MRRHGLFALVAFLAALVAVYAFNEQPGYTDAFYHFNAALRLVQGQGLTDEALWVYIGMPATLPAPSHLYWMPGTSLVAAAGMVLFGMSYAAALSGFALCLWGAALVAYGVALRQGAGLWLAWCSGLLLISGGFFLRFWGVTDTFAPYALAGGLCLAALGVASSGGRRVWWFIAGMAAGAGHLLRSDGLLLLIVGVVVAVWPPRRLTRQTPQHLLLLGVGYVLVMSPWFIRNLSVLGVPLPIGGAQALWYREYDELFAYPPRASAASFFAEGMGLFIETRLWALGQNLQTMLFVLGNLVLAPLMLLGGWQRRKDAFWQGGFWAATGMYLAFSLAFPFPGVRGGLFHAGAGLLPVALPLAMFGLSDAVAWMARRRRTWKPMAAQRVFSVGLLIIISVYGLSIAWPRRELVRMPALYTALDAALPDGARVMVNDPAQLYYYTGRGGVVTPNEPPETILTIAERYGVDYVLLEPPNIPSRLVWDAPPPFLQRLEFPLTGVELYVIVPD